MKGLFVLIVLLLVHVHCQVLTPSCLETLNSEQLGDSGATLFPTSSYVSTFVDLQGIRYVEFSYLFPQWNWATTFFSPFDPKFSNPIMLQIPWCALDIQVTGPCVSQWAFAPVFEARTALFAEFSGHTTTSLAAVAIFIDNTCYASVLPPENRVVNVTYSLMKDITIEISQKNYAYTFTDDANPGFISEGWDAVMCTDSGVECVATKPDDLAIQFMANLSAPCYNTDTSKGLDDWVYLLQNNANKPVMYLASITQDDGSIDPPVQNFNGLMLPFYQVYFASSSITGDYNITGQAGSFNAGGEATRILRSTLPPHTAADVCTCGINIQCYPNGTYIINDPIQIPDANNFNSLPYPMIHWTPSRPRLNLPIEFSSEASYDPTGFDNTDYKYSWTNPIFPEPGFPAIIENSTGINTNITFMRSGEYVIRLAITDSVGTGSRDIAVKAANSRPIARIQGKPKGNPLGATVNITSIGTHDPDGLPFPISYNWTSVGGPLIDVTNTTTNFTFLVTENTTICLQVFDGDKYSFLNVTSCLFIYVNEIPPEIPLTPLDPVPSFNPLPPGVYPPSVTSPRYPPYARPPNTGVAPFSLSPNPAIEGPSPARTPEQNDQITWFFVFSAMFISLAFIVGMAFKRFGKDRERKKERLENNTEDHEGVSLIQEEEEEGDKQL